jgi:hypothetical protein
MEKEAIHELKLLELDEKFVDHTSETFHISKLVPMYVMILKIFSPKKWRKKGGFDSKHCYIMQKLDHNIGLK